MAKIAKTIETIEVESLKVGSVKVWIRGLTPIILHRMAAKAMRELLLPRGRKGAAEREQSLKHNPLEEYRDSATVRLGKGPTRIVFPSSAIKAAIANAALETKGTSKAQLGRLIWVEGVNSDLYGVPQLHMAVVRSADMNRTPDVRTRAIISDWCIPVTIRYTKPQMSERTLFQLLANAGIIIGIGDFRQEKGKGNFGQFEIVTEAECKSIIDAGGLKEQDAALKAPECYDADTSEMMGWFGAEVVRRGKSEQLGRPAEKTAKKTADALA